MNINIYAIGRKEDKELILKCKEYLESCVDSMASLKIKRPLEENLTLGFDHGFLEEEDVWRSKILVADYVICAGRWREDHFTANQYRVAESLGITIFEMNYEKVPMRLIRSYLPLVRPIEEEVWDTNKEKPLLVLEHSNNTYEIIDGHHRHALAEKVGIRSMGSWVLAPI